jgi:hypothetical protein
MLKVFGPTQKVDAEKLKGYGMNPSDVGGITQLSSWDDLVNYGNLCYTPKGRYLLFLTFR